MPDDHIEIFSNIYEKRVWGNNHSTLYEGSSGGGSTIEFNSKEYIPFMRSFIKHNDVTSVVDLGCGDWQCSEHIYRDTDVKYTGYDAYKKVVDANTLKHPKYSFVHLDILNNVDKICDGDLCILKDIIQHWTVAEINSFLSEIIAKKKFRYILVINSCDQKYDNQEDKDRSRPLSCKYLPLKSYTQNILLRYNDKEVSLIDCTDRSK